MTEAFTEATDFEMTRRRPTPKGLSDEGVVQNPAQTGTASSLDATPLVVEPPVPASTSTASVTVAEAPAIVHPTESMHFPTPLTTSRPPTPPPPAWGPPPGPPRYPAPPGDVARRAAPPEIWLVSIGLVVLAGFVIYPVFDIGWSVFSGMFTTNAFARAFSTLVVAIVGVLVISAVALVLMAVGLIRGNRAARILVCVLCTVVSIAEIVSYDSTPSGFGQSGAGDGELAGVLIVSAIVILLLTLPSTAREFFANRGGAVGVDCAVATNYYLGTVCVCNAVLLTLAGALGYKYVWFGIGFGVVGLALLGISSYLRSGRAWSQGVAIVLYLGIGIVGLVYANEQDLTSDPSTIIPLLTAVFSIGALIGPESSRALFAGPAQQVLSQPVARAGWFVLAVALVVSAATGFAGASDPLGSDSFGSGDSVLTPDPITPSFAGTEEQSTSLTYGDAYSEATAALAQLSDYGAQADVCDGGALPSATYTSYSIDEVDPDTSGNFDVSATVTLDDGATDVVTFTVTAPSGVPCVDASTYSDTTVSAPPEQETNEPTSSEPTAVAEPADVPDLPSQGDPIPTDASAPAEPDSGTVVSYLDDSTTPTAREEVLEYSPAGLDSDETAAISDIIGFMTDINRQHFQAAWDLSTWSLSSSADTAGFRHGYATSRFYQVAFGQPMEVSGDLIAVPGRFVSRQDPAAQGYPDGVTDCSYWPQYIFVVAYVDGQWRTDTAGKYASRSELDQFRRMSHGDALLNPLAQRVSC